MAKIISYSINIKCKNITLGMILACVCNSHANTFECMRIGCMPMCPCRNVACLLHAMQGPCHCGDVSVEGDGG